MSYELDLSQYVGLFLQEAREQLEILEQETLKLEEDPTPERLQSIFRAAHTLKGSARAMGFLNMGELTHEMENVLDQLRHGTLELDTSIADALLACQDTLGQMILSIEAGNGDAAECALLVRKLQTILNPSVDEQEEPTEQLPVARDDDGFVSQLTEDQRGLLIEALNEGPIFHAKFRLDLECAMKYVRAFMAISAIQEYGEILVSVPDAEALEEEKFEQEFELVFKFSEDIQALESRLKSISEVSWLSLGQYDPAQLTISEPLGVAGSDNVVTLNSASHAPANDTASTADLTATPEVTPATAPGGFARMASEATNTAANATPKKSDSGQTVRVDVTRLDILMNLVGELVIDRTRIAQIGDELADKFDDPNLEALAETVGHIGRITSDLQDQIMKARMMPIESVFNRFPRVVRDLAQKLDKEVKLEVSGGETELDRSVIEVIGDPLLHILRNSIDHGLETPDEREKAGKPRVGSVQLSARHQENHIVIEICDDGRGIDVDRVKQKAVQSGFVTREQAERMSDKEALQLIFASGLSTAKEVTDVSGRGVGMDIVRSNLQKLGGIIDLDTTLGEGTRFSLRLPLTLAIIRGLLVSVAGVTYVIPLGSVVETLLVNRDELQSVNRRPVIVIRGLTTPLVRLEQQFSKSGAPEHGTENNQHYVVIVGLAEQRVGLVVDRLIGEREVVIKSLSRFCGDVAGISGATILGDGNVALIMDVNSVISSQRN